MDDQITTLHTAPITTLPAAPITTLHTAILVVNAQLGDDAAMRELIGTWHPLV